MPVCAEFHCHPKAVRLAAWSALLGAALFALPASALTILGTGVNAEEVAALAGILTQSTQTAVTVDQLLTRAEQSVEAAQQSAALLRTATEVIVDFQYLTQNPNQIFDDAQASFNASFPELEAIARDMEVAHANLAGERAGEPRSLFQLIADGRGTAQGAYQTLMAYDNLTDGQLEAYLRRVDLLRQTAESVQAVRQEAETQMNAQKAAIVAARAAALSATAQTQAASAALETSRILEQQYLNDRKREAGNEVAKAKNAADLATAMPADENVDGTAVLKRAEALPETFSGLSDGAR